MIKIIFSHFDDNHPIQKEVMDELKEAAKKVFGVKSITNFITVKPKLSSTGIKRKIESAFQQAEILCIGFIDQKDI